MILVQDMSRSSLGGSGGGGGGGGGDGGGGECIACVWALRGGP